MALIDDSEHPLVRFNFSPDVSDAELERAVAALEEIFARGERVAIVTDISGLDVQFTLQRRAHLVRLMQTIQKDADRLMIAALYIAATTAGRGVVTALNWARGKRPYPVRVVATAEEADAIARKLIAEATR